MSPFAVLKSRIEAITYEYEHGDLLKEEYLELIKDINTANLIANTAEEVAELETINKLINNIITGVSLVA